MYGDAGLLTTEDGEQFLQKLDTLLNKSARINTQIKSRQEQTEVGGNWMWKNGKPSSKQRLIACGRITKTSGWRVVSVESENVGWDLTVDNGEDELHVEVKGHQGDRIQCELTPNEYKQAKRKNHAYYLAVVTNALQKTTLANFPT